VCYNWLKRFVVRRATPQTIRTLCMIPIGDRFAVISFNFANRDRRRDDILCQVLSEPLSAGGDLSWLRESDKTFGIVSPGSVEVSFHHRIGNIISEHFQEMILPFSVHHVEREVGGILPLFPRINSASALVSSVTFSPSPSDLGGVAHSRAYI